MGPLTATGGFAVDADHTRQLIAGINAICTRFGFPDGEEFKWSPRRNQWMYSNLPHPQRGEFFSEIISALAEVDSIAVVAIEDHRATPLFGKDAMNDTARLLFERVELVFIARQADGFIIVDTPPGDRRAEDVYLLDCLSGLVEGSDYVQHERITTVITAPSKYNRLLQAADLITSCINSAVAGETQYAPQTCETIKSILRRGDHSIGGYGVKIHPDYKYMNLYHWVLGDELVQRGSGYAVIPSAHWPYTSDPMVY